MEQFYFSGFTIGLLAATLMVVALTVNFKTTKNKSVAGQWIANAFLVAAIALSAFTLLSCVLDTGHMWWLWVLAYSAVFGTHAILQFSYHYPRNIHPVESLWAGRVSLAAAIIAFISHAVLVRKYAPQFSPNAGLLFYDINWPILVMTIQVLWAAGVQLRKSAALSIRCASEPGVRLWMPWVLASNVLGAKNRDGSATRDFGLFFLAMAVATVALPLAIHGHLGWLSNMNTISIGFGVLVFVFTMIYVNNAAERTSFSTKVVGSSLFTLITTFGFIAVMVVAEAERSYDAVKKSDMAAIRAYLNSGDESWLPPSVKFIAQKHDDARTEDKRFELTFAPDNFRAKAADYLSEGEAEQEVDLGSREFWFVHVADVESYFVIYDLDVGDNEYEIAYSYREFRAAIHQAGLKITYILVLSVLFVLVLNPIFIRANITKPLGDLLQGVKRVNEGDVDVAVTVRTTDEIGFLTSSFNSMVQSIRHAREQLALYAENLEERVAQRTAELNQAKQQTDEIFRTVEQGLFLLAKRGDSFAMENEYSSATERLFESASLGGRDFMALVSAHVEESVARDVSRFLGLMFRDNVDEEALMRLNPLAEAQFLFDSGEKHLSFRFARVMAGNRVGHLMVTIRDITHEVLLARQLQETERRSRTQMELLFKLLNADPSLLDDFIEAMRNELANVESIMRADGCDLRTKVTELYRSTHTIKGNAALLELDFIVELAHDLEERLKKLQQLPVLGGEHFAGLSVAFESLRHVSGEMELLVAKLLDFQRSFGTQQGSVNRSIKSAVEKLVGKLARELGREANVSFGDFDIEPLDSKQRMLVKDALVQFIRNSVSHGIEPRTERERAAKPPVGRIAVSSFVRNNQFVLDVEDDGRGIALEKLRRKAVEKGLASEQEAARWSVQQVINLIFQSGLSTADQVTLAAGQGVGLDAVKERLDAAGASVQVETAPDRFTRFRVVVNLTHSEAEHEMKDGADSQIPNYGAA